MKNKHFYQIFKLKIKPWIKYWLIKQTEFKGVLSDILEGISFYLTDSLNMKFKMFKIYGRTTQESTTGANLQKFNPRESSDYNYKCDNNGQVTVSGNVSSVVTLGYNLASNPMSLSAGTYKLKVVGNISSNTLILNNQSSVIALDNNQEASIALNEDTNSFYLQIYLNAGTHNDNFYITLASGNTATTERYTGGEPAPNPIYPYAIKNTGDNGSVNEKIENKNIFNKSKATNGRYVKNTDGTLGYSDTLSASDFIKVRANVTYYQSNVNNYYSCLYDEDKNFIKQINSNSFTPTVDGYMRTSFLTTNIDIVQIEQSSTPSGYVPHSEQNISFPLAEGQKLMEGDYLADDGIHSLWNEDTVNGTTATFSDAKTNGAYYCNQKVSGNLTGQTITFDTSVTNAIVQYELAQEQVIPYTQEQQTAWEQIKNLKTYKPVTHISSEDETPAELKIQYWKEV